MTSAVPVAEQPPVTDHSISGRAHPASAAARLLRNAAHARRSILQRPVLLLALVPVLLVAINLSAVRDRTNAARTEFAHTRSLQANSLAGTLYIPERPWKSNPPRWCTELMENPRERPRTSSVYDCRRGRFGAVCEDGTARFFSQYNQDVWTWKNHWQYLKRRGVYLDIAANEPVRISNTYFFDACLNWRGLCVEAHPAYRDLLVRMRSCGIMPTCVSDREENVSFVLDAGSSGVHSTNRNVNAKFSKEQLHITCVRTADAIAASGMHLIDMLSLDVEGHEHEVLKGIDWARTRINVIVIESLSEKTKALLHALGYRRADTPSTPEDKAHDGNLFSDFVFLHPDVVWGKPV